jgi:hypothetical protein
MSKSLKDFNTRVDSKNPPTRGLRASIFDYEETLKAIKANEFLMDKK